MTGSRPRRGAPARAALAALAGSALLALSACTGGGSSAPSTVVHTETEQVTRTPSQAPPFTPAPATTVPPLGGRSVAPAGERFAACPYIANGAGASGGAVPGNNIANLEGDRVGRSTILTGYHPVGCRFYFAYSYGDTDHEAVADILPSTFPTATAAHNALVLTAEAGRNPQSAPDFVPGVDGIQYQTRFFGPDGDLDWAFAFAKGRVLVVVHTQQSDSEINGLLIGKAIVDKF